MTTLAWVLLGAAAVFAIIDWVAVARGHMRVEHVAKPATLVALIGVALAVEGPEPAQRAWWLVALVFSLGGDVFLMLPRRFVLGLASFLVAHLAYIGGFVTRDLHQPSLILAVPLLVAATLGPRIVRGAHRQHRKLALPVTAYLLVITAMLMLALASGSKPAAAGALLFFVSDALIGFRNFVRERAWHDLAVIVTYHLGQALLVLSLVDGLPR
jgi:uncharacterized membrane protein YhhN